MRVSAGSFFLLPWIAVCGSVHPAIIERDVAIIGGGSSGTHCAVSIRDHNYSVIVVDRDSILGGHADTYIDASNGKHVNIGVQLFHNSNTVHGYVTGRLGVPLKIENVLADGMARKSIYADFDTGETVNAPTTNPSVILAAAQTYLSIYETRFTYLLDGVGTSQLPDPIPEELMMPFPDWAQKNNVSILTPLFTQLQGNLGEISKVSTLDLLKSAPPSLINSALTGFYFVSSGDTQDIYTAAGKVLGDNLYYSSTPLPIKRRGDNCSVVIVVSTPKSRRTIHAKHLIMAVPPLIEQLLTLDATPSEKFLFDNFSGVGYFGAVVSNRGVNTSITNFDLKSPFGIFSQPGLNVLSPNVAGELTVYGSTATPVSDIDAVLLLDKQLDTLQTKGLVPKGNITLDFLTNHSPFWLTAPADKVKGGFWRDVYSKVQGRQSTWWTGAAWAAYDSTLIWEYNNKIVIPGVLAALRG